MVKRLILILFLLLLPSIVNAGVIVVVSNGCPYCVPVKQYATELQKEGYDITIINASENREAVTKYNITAVPTIIVMSGNTEQSRRTGAISKEDLRSLSLVDNPYDNLNRNNKHD